MASCLNSHALLIDLQTYVHNHVSASALLSTVSSSFRPTRRARTRASSGAVISPARRPRDRFSSGNGPLSPPQIEPASTSTSRSDSVSELDVFLELVPPRMRSRLFGHAEIGDLIELVMDLGRKPIARFPSGDWLISEEPVKVEDLKHSISIVGEFSDDNRSGINNSLHRISAIRNRKMQIIGLTCRVGRAICGSAEMIRDLIENGGSVLVIGPPGVGKTTLIREIARVLADEQMKRVVIVDTSNEIGGDGDIPHSGIGRARRMQVPNVNMQHNVMIEAVENHMPETIIIDEIGTELEAMAASTIAQRGVQLVGTAHGVTIESVIKNPSLQILVGGIESVTLGDEEARKRKVQKTILERKGPPTFTSAVEMVSKTDCRVHHRLDSTVDAILAGKSPIFEVRRVEEKSNDSSYISAPAKYQEDVAAPNSKPDPAADNNFDLDAAGHGSRHVVKGSMYKPLSKKISPVKVYTYKILEADLLQVAEVMGLENAIDVTDDITAAAAVLASSSELKQNPWIRSVAKFHRIPVFVIKTTTMAQMVKAVRMILKMDTLGSVSCGSSSHSQRDFEIEDDAPKRKPSIEEIDALEEVRLAIEYIVIPGGEPVELLPRRSDIVARQIELVESYQLSAENSGTETHPRLQILPRRSNKTTFWNQYLRTEAADQGKLIPGYKSLTGSAGGATVTRLPLLPE